MSPVAVPPIVTARSKNPVSASVAAAPVIETARVGVPADCTHGWICGSNCQAV